MVPSARIELATFRSSVWRSPIWAIKARSRHLDSNQGPGEIWTTTILRSTNWATARNKICLSGRCFLYGQPRHWCSPARDSNPPVQIKCQKKFEFADICLISPPRGIEPRPHAWKARILTTRPWGIGRNMNFVSLFMTCHFQIPLYLTCQTLPTLEEQVATRRTRRIRKKLKCLWDFFAVWYFMMSF